MELRHLRYFVAVAEELHFTRAAERLHIGQPPLSQQIQALETELGVQLLERSKRWVRLTEAGKLFLDDARRILALSEQAALTARRAQRGEAGELRIGFTFSTPFTPLFAKVINSYRQQFPLVSLTLHEMATLPQIAAIDQRGMDLGFVRPPEAAIPDTVSLSVLRQDPLSLVLPDDHALAAKPSVAIKELEGLPFVMYPNHAGTGIRPQIFRLCRAAGFVPHIAQEAEEASTIIGLVAAGCGVSILPASFDRIRLDGVCYRPISDADAGTTLFLALRKGPASPLVAAFVALANQAAGLGQE
ncbi:LysR substrate-binding domain-containing protein [Janthinobacterium agaricidamnosum]|uniref:Bacterial regulatory helix-turn-helix, lysR family protein n=1 Tax=Janthinobacterium agaricidamnosum NBRC 102515 = DSM 9628 TaxID=1349767 RepID=W0VBR0_9BURK|nr:LysR substrate-binding domain-containing protein [Janthinobacterium agaricidamnosum]CDG84798.1 bacterial regulatory helix-turn-helix, lysR family protein [Janthinobacterium agaricidamnosum NBRC 102515 = DSM 9628]